MSTSRDLQSSLVVDSVGIKLGQLIEHGRNVDDDTVAENVHASWVENTAGEQMEGILVAVGDDGMAGVGTTIESSADIVVLGKDVDKLALTLVTPLGAKNDAEAGVEAVSAALTNFKKLLLETHDCLKLIGI